MKTNVIPRVGGVFDKIIPFLAKLLLFKSYSGSNGNFKVKYAKICFLSNLNNCNEPNEFLLLV